MEESIILGSTPSPYSRNPTTNVILPATPFTPVTLKPDQELLDSQLKAFFGTTGMNVNQIVQKVTDCQAEIFKAQRDYIPRAMFRFENLELLLTEL